MAFWTIAAQLAPSILGAAGSALGASSASRTAKQQAALARETAATNTRLAAEQRSRDEATYAPEIARGSRADSYIDALTYGSGGGASAQPSDPAAFMQANPALQRLAEEQAAREGRPVDYASFGAAFLADPANAAYLNSSAVTRDDVFGQVRASMPWQLTDEEFAAQEGIEQAGFDRNLNEYARDRTAIRTIADEDFAARRGYTDAAIASRAALNDTYQTQARDRIAASLGLTGQIGKAARAGAQAADQLNLEFADTERTWRNEDYDPYSAVRLATEERYGDRVAGRYATNTAARSTNQANRTAGRQGSYADYVQGLRSDATRGVNARDSVSQAGRTYTNTAINQNSQAAGVASDAVAQRGAVQQQFYGDVADAAGQGYAAVTAARKRAETPAPAAPTYGAAPRLAGYAAVRRPTGLNAYRRAA